MDFSGRLDVSGHEPNSRHAQIIQGGETGLAKKDLQVSVRHCMMDVGGLPRLPIDCCDFALLSGSSPSSGEA
jgi:hypothetical protein